MPSLFIFPPVIIIALALHSHSLIGHRYYITSNVSKQHAQHQLATVVVFHENRVLEVVILEFVTKETKNCATEVMRQYQVTYINHTVTF